MNWISCKERLPEYDNPILLYIPAVGVMVGFRSENKAKYKNKYNYSFHTLSKDFNPLSWDINQVTHWMPLPEPPKD